MAKFDLNSIKNNMSADVTDKKKVSISDMIPCRLNEYSCDNLDMLADDIADNGLLQNFVLMETKEHDGKYTIIAGHRRYYAIQQLIADGRKDPSYKWDAKIIPYTEDELSIRMALVVANGYRDKSTSEKWFEYETRKAAMERDIANGVKIPGRKREYLASLMGVSISQAGKFESIDKNGIEAVVEKVKEGEENGGLSIATANEISKLPAEKQEMIVTKASSDKEARELLKAEKAERREETAKSEAQVTKPETEKSTETRSDNSSYDDTDTRIDNLISEMSESSSALSNDEFLKAVRYVVDQKKSMLDEDFMNKFEGIMLTLTNLLGKDKKTVLDIINS